MTLWNNAFQNATPFSSISASFFLATSTNLTYTVPGTPDITYRAAFTYTEGSNIWIRKNGTAAVPGSGLVTTLVNQEFRPAIKYVQGGDVINAISSDASGAQFGIALLQLP